MAISLKTTQELGSHGVKFLVYGPSGAGKTTLIRTMPDPKIILSAEGGLLSLSGENIPYIQINTISDLAEAYEFLKSEEGMQYKNIALDSISEIAEVILTNEKKNSKDPRQAYGAMQDIVSEMIRSFRDLEGKNVYFSAKVEKSQDDLGHVMWAPSMPGNKLAQNLPYFFDEVLALRAEKDETGETQRALMCETDGIWTAKDRSGKLDAWEPADLGAIIKKIGGENV